jgi:glutamate 5-kinase
MSSTALRQSVLAAAKRVVVKLGTQLLTDGQGRLDVPYFREIARQIAELRRGGRQVTVVSSGAVGAGLAELALSRRPSDVAALQAVAAVGQPRLMLHLHDAFAEHKIKVAQVLLTRSDFDDRVRFLNIRNCLSQLHGQGCIPIINENDTVAVDELRFGDNDMLAAMICNAIRADALVLLTVVNGLLDSNNEPIDLVESVPAMMHVARSDRSKLGTGGITSKLEAARLVTESGEIAVIANGRTPDILPRLLAGQASVGTVFVPAKRKLDSRARWIGLTRRPAGFLTVDDGAARAVTQRGSSLLATGIIKMAGEFDRGALLSICDSGDREIARGLSNYNSVELNLIMGKRSSEFEKLLGRRAFDEIIHRDNLVPVNTR